MWTIGTADPLRARAAQVSVLVHEQRSYATAPLWFVARILVHGAGGYQVVGERSARFDSQGTPSAAIRTVMLVVCRRDGQHSNGALLFR